MRKFMNRICYYKILDYECIDFEMQLLAILSQSFQTLKQYLEKLILWSNDDYIQSGHSFLVLVK